MTLAQIGKPAVEPVTLSQAKSYLRIENTDEDVLIAELITAARQYLEQTCGVRLITQTWRQYEDCWPRSGMLTLGARPVKSVQSITVYNEAGTPNIIPANDYQVDAISQSARIYLADGLTVGQPINGIEIDFTVGFGDTGVDVPDVLKRANLLLVAHWFEFRGAIAPQEQPVSFPPGIDALIAPFKGISI